MTTLLSGTAIAETLRTRIGQDTETFARAFGHRPGLAVVLVGNDPASQVYVRSKVRKTEEAGMSSFEHRLDERTSESDLLALIESLNCDDAVDGILVQLPLPRHVDAGKVLDAIDPGKDVDGFHPINVGRLATGRSAFVPCTPLGCMQLISAVRTDLSGLEAVVVGRSNIVGKPVTYLLLAAGCTVTVAHSQSVDLATVCRRADILVVAVGRPEMVRAHWVRPGAIVIDVGINRVPASAGNGFRLVGDVAFTEVAPIAGAITPVPGGVGPMTIAMLLANTLDAARLRRT